MIDRIRVFYNKCVAAKNKIVAPFAALSAPIFNPIKRWLRPANEKYLAYTHPIRAWHSNLRVSSPITAFLIRSAYTLFRYGLNFLLALIFLSLIGVFGHMPSRAELRTKQNSNTSDIFSADSVLIGKFYIENRTEIALDAISPYVVTALLAVEDKRFFEHSGIDIFSWLRVFKGVITNTQGLGGGSTLSQQLAKNLYPRKNYWIPGLSILINKIRENIISIKLEGIYDKEQLLALYLNTVPFGGDRFGINVASRYFYNKKAKDLNPAESATLIGMLKATTRLDPTRNAERSRKRRNLVLERMVANKDFVFNDPDLKTVTELIANGKITDDYYQKIKEKPVNAKKNIGDDFSGRNAYFREYLRVISVPAILKNLTKEDGTPYNQYKDGLKIYTTIDSRLQQFAEDAVQKHMSSLQSKFDKHWRNYKGEELPWGEDRWLDSQIVHSDRYLLLKEANANTEAIRTSFNTPVNMTVFSWKNGGGDTDTIMTPLDSIKHYFLMLNTGFMAMDHTNGHVKSWVGGINFKYFKFDHINTHRQVGSTFKPIVYAAAIRDSMKPCQYIKNEQVTILDWTPRNSDEVYGGWASLYGGITYSINVIAAKLIQKVGIQKTVDLAAAMGVTSKLPREFGISLGAADITLYDMMKVYGTIANGGLRPEPVTVLMIKDRNGKIIYDFNQELAKNPKLGAHVQALSEDEAAIMTRMMQGVIDQGTGRKFRDAYGAVGEYAGKTGTTQNHSDGWFICFNPHLTTGVWVGGPSRAVRFRDMGLGQGSSMALPIVGEFWKKIRGHNYFKSWTDTRFKENSVAINKVGCPFRIGIHPDTLELLMRDTLLRDSIQKMGYKGLKQLAKDVFGTGEGEGEDLPEILEGQDVSEEDLKELNEAALKAKSDSDKNKLDDKTKQTDKANPLDKTKPGEKTKPNDKTKPDDIKKADNAKKPDDVKKADDAKKPDDKTKITDPKKADAGKGSGVLKNQPTPDPKDTKPAKDGKPSSPEKNTTKEGKPLPAKKTQTKKTAPKATLPKEKSNTTPQTNQSKG